MAGCEVLEELHGLRRAIAVAVRTGGEAVPAVGRYIGRWRAGVRVTNLRTPSGLGGSKVTSARKKEGFDGGSWIWQSHAGDWRSLRC